jgi:hypothetical protein
VLDDRPGPEAGGGWDIAVGYDDLQDALAQVGDGKWNADDMSRILAARDRTLCGPVAPAEGLYLVRVDY